MLQLSILLQSPGCGGECWEKNETPISHGRAMPVWQGSREQALKLGNTAVLSNAISRQTQRSEAVLHFIVVNDDIKGLYSALYMHREGQI